MTANFFASLLRPDRPPARSLARSAKNGGRMTDLDKIIDSVVTLRASLAIDTETLTVADRRLLRAHVEHCTLDLQHLLSKLIAPSDALLGVAAGQDISVSIG
jgi:hypothetical protein